MKVLFVVHGFPPAQHSGTFRSAAFARYLPDFGIEPLVICASDEPDLLTYRNHGSEGDQPPARVIARVDWKLKSPHGRIAQFARRFPLGWTWAQRRFYREVVNAVIPFVREAIRTERPHVLYASAPPPAALVLAAQAAEEMGTPYVCDLRDPWSYYSWARYRHYVDFLFERAMERRVLSRAAAILANTPTARRLLVSELHILESRVFVIPNGYDETDFAGVPPIPSRPRDVFEIVYTGLLSFRPGAQTGLKNVIKKRLGVDYSPLTQDPNTRSPVFFLKAVEEVLQRRPEYRRQLRIRFVGRFPRDVLNIFSAFPFPAVLHVIPPVPKQEAVRIAAEADLALLLQIEMKRGGRDFCTSVPGKLFDYLRAGVPTLAAMQRSDATDLIEKLGAGTVVPPRDVKAMAAAIESALDEWTARNRVPRRLHLSGIAQFDRRRLTAELADILRRAAERRE